MTATFRGLGATDVPPIAPGYPNRLLDQLHMAAILEDRQREQEAAINALSGYHRTEAEFPELRALSTFSAAWYRMWRALHAVKYPDADASTRANLAMFVDMAEKREARS